MKIKTICELKEKAWYRLIKVLFFATLLIGLGIFNFIAFTINSGIKQVDQNQTTIQCSSHSQNKAVFTPQNIGISLESRYFTGGQFDYEKYFKGYNDYAIKAILIKCSPKIIANLGNSTNPAINDIYDLQKAVEIKNVHGAMTSAGNPLTQDQTNTLNADYSTYQQETKSMLSNEKTQYLDFSFKMFDITPVFTYNAFLTLFFVGNIIILFASEAIRRVFYYIVLGKIKPLE